MAPVAPPTTPKRQTSQTAQPDRPTTRRRSTSEDSTSRKALLDAARRLMLEEGYASVTARRVAAEAGLKPQLVHYYFASMDDLFLSVVRRSAARSIEQVEQALTSPQPLRALWSLTSDPTGTAMTTELMALANHRKAIRAELADAAERFRTAQLDAVRGALERYGVDTDQLPVEAVLVLIAGLARVIVMEDSFGMTVGHAETLALVERYLTQLEGPLHTPPSTTD
jgi:AcrR family transcriptional regulator